MRMTKRVFKFFSLLLGLLALASCTRAMPDGYSDTVTAIAALPPETQTALANLPTDDPIMLLNAFATQTAMVNLPLETQTALANLPTEDPMALLELYATQTAVAANPSYATQQAILMITPLSMEISPLTIVRPNGSAIALDRNFFASVPLRSEVLDDKIIKLILLDDIFRQIGLYQFDTVIFIGTATLQASRADLTNISLTISDDGTISLYKNQLVTNITAIVVR